MNEEENHKLTTISRDEIIQIASHFYRLVKQDDLIGKMYPEDDWDGSEERLRDFLLFRLIGEQDYLVKRGHPRLRMRHARFLIGKKESDRWIDLMDQAMRDTGIPETEFIKLHNFFHGVAEFMRNH